MSRPKWMTKKLEAPTTRSRSKKQESKIAKDLRLGNAYASINSGATLGQNDVIADFCEVEAKVTSKQSFSMKVADWNKMEKKCAVNKIPIFMIEFEDDNLELAVVKKSDLLYFIEAMNNEEG